MLEHWYFKTKHPGGIEHPAEQAPELLRFYLALEHPGRTGENSYLFLFVLNLFYADSISTERGKIYFN